MKEQIKAWLNANSTNDVKALEIEIIAEKFAINFVSWIDKNKKEIKKIIIIEELLEKYKKEIEKL